MFFLGLVVFVAVYGVLSEDRAGRDVCDHDFGARGQDDDAFSLVASDDGQVAHVP